MESTVGALGNLKTVGLLVPCKTRTWKAELHR